ncbi:MAG: hypothetical protein A3G41_00690 [Elusimicrobia bacterium RIFCSPLOWO2_12_FULL_59_9]|nr:MAG: hypothetical protein A3G41_00690 [Elusimicrobia bacterium RIFCSPLOWO2_12_FULL_59_9]
MKTAELKEIIDWMKSTDLLEATWKPSAAKSGAGFSIQFDGPAAAAVFPKSSLAAVTSEGVGLFRWAEAGRKARPLSKNSPVEKGQTLGVLEAGKRLTPVKAPASGRIHDTCVEEGQVVQYGQPLFFIEPS